MLRALPMIVVVILAVARRPVYERRQHRVRLPVRPDDRALAVALYIRAAALTVFPDSIWLPDRMHPNSPEENLRVFNRSPVYVLELEIER